MEAIVTTKGQIVIPAKLRRKYGINAGTRIRLIEDGERIILQPITREYIHSLRGKYKGKGLLKVLLADKKREREL